MEFIGWLTTGLAIIGVLLNNRRLIACFPIWIVSNALSAMIHGYAGIYSLMARDLVFLILAFEGWRRWAVENNS